MISVVIPVYKKVDEFMKNLDHNLKFLKNSDIIVLNDDPSQSIKNRLEKYKVRLIENKKNLGFAGTVDKGIRAAKNDYVFLLNSDVKLLDDSYKTAVKKFERNDKIFGIAFSQREKDGSIVGKNKLFWNQGLLQHSKADDLDEGETGWVEGGSSIIRKDIYEQIGGFDTIFSPFYWEDIELSYRAQKHGYITWFDPTVLVEHHHESTIGSFWNRNEIKTIAYRNQLLCSWKYIRDTNLVMHIIYLKIRGMKSLIHSDLPFIKAYFMAVPFLFQSRFYKIRYYTYMWSFLKRTSVLLFIICLASFFLTIYRPNNAPVCTNADESAFGYNAYSILKTGRDEYGTFLPLRLKSFGDNKLPLYSYLSVPFVATLGLNDLGIRGLNLFSSFLLPLAVYFLTKELLGKKSYALVAATMTALSLSTHITARQAHESVISLLMSLSMFIFYLRSLRTRKPKDIILFLTALALSLLSYHPARLLALFLGALHLITFFVSPKIEKKRLLALGGIFAIVLALLLSVDIFYNPSRISNLLFVNSPGFSLRINELRGEGANRLLYNKLTLGAKELVYQNLEYFSPQFLLSRGDENYRFGYPGMSLVTGAEFLLLFIGLYYLFKNKNKHRFFITALIMIAPLSGSLSWAGISLTRALFLFAIVFMIAGYGAIELIAELSKKQKGIGIGLLVLLQIVGLFISWDFYLNHYPKRAVVIRAQECGYSELAQYIQKYYASFKKFYITKQNGEPYMHLLFRLQFPPEKYQPQSHLTAPDQYGFGQIERFDKFVFSLPNQLNEKNVVYVGFPEELKSRPGFNVKSDTKKIKIIRVGTEEIFWILER